MRAFKVFVNILFVLFTGTLFIMSLFTHCDIDIFDYSQTKSLVHHHTVIYAGIMLIILLLLFAVLTVLKKLGTSDRTLSIITGVLTALGVLACIGWIIFCESYPRFDQEIIHAEALAWAGYIERPSSPWYFTVFARQRGILIFLTFLMKIFGPSVMIWRIVNVAGYLLMITGIYLISVKLSADRVLSCMTVLVTLSFIPLIIYTSYQYGTLLALAFLIMGFYWILKYSESGKLSHAILCGLMLSLGVQMHQSALIALVASVIYLFVKNIKTDLKKTIIGIAAIFVIYLMVSKSIDLIYESSFDTSGHDTLPATVTIYMGITSDDATGGPGAMDETEQGLFKENNENASAANKAAVSLILQTMKEYLNGTRSLTFFTEKIKYQWLEPSFGAQKNIYLNDPKLYFPENTERYIRFSESKIRTTAFKLLVSHMMMIYLLSLITGIYTLLHKERSDIHFLIQLFFIGGFVFQLFWESLSRYCLSYYVLLFFEAGYGLIIVYDKLFHGKKRGLT